LFPEKSYVICASPRSGSFLLCEALANTGLAGRPSEHLSRHFEDYWYPRWKPSSYRDYVGHVIRLGTTPNRVFGTKLVFHQFEYAISRLRESPDCRELAAPRLLSTVFPNLRYIWTTRQDKVRQAVSFLKANQTNIWCVTDQPLARFGEPRPNQMEYSFEAIDRLVKSMEWTEEAWKTFFCTFDLNPLVVVYEHFAQEYDETTGRVLDYLEIDLPKQFKIAEPHMQRQADAVSEEWVERYRMQKAWF
jgi:trehalose 2-sulfotransferase